MVPAVVGGLRALVDFAHFLLFTESSVSGKRSKCWAIGMAAPDHCTPDGVDLDSLATILRQLRTSARCPRGISPAQETLFFFCECAALGAVGYGKHRRHY